MSNLLNWADKKNSTLLADFIAKHGAEYCMTAEEINEMRDAVNEMAVIQQSTFMGTAEPAGTPDGSGNRYWISVVPGTYTNFGGVVVSADSLAIISVTAAGVFSISQVGFVIPPAINKIIPWTATSFASGDQVSHLGKDWVSNADTLAGDVPGTSSKWVERLTGYAEEEKLIEEIKKINDSLTVFKDDTTGDLNIEDEAGNIILKITDNGQLIIFDGSEGGFNVSLQTILDIISSQTEINIGDSVIIEGSEAFSIEDENGHCVLLIKSNGDIFYKDKSSGNTGTQSEEIPEYLAEINHVISFGQSLSLGSQGAGTASNPFSTTQLYNSLMFNGGVQLPATKTDFVPLVEAIYESPLSGMFNTIVERILTIEGKSFVNSGYQMLGSVAGAGGAPISQLIKGTGQYNVFLSQVTAGLNVATSKGLSYNFPAFLWIQGEADLGGDEQTYYTALRQLRTDIDTDVKAITGQKNDVKCLVYQTNQFGTYPYAIPNAQYRAALDDANIFMATPMYNLEFESEIGSGVHQTAYGTYSMGVTMGLAYIDFVTEKNETIGNVLSPKTIKTIGNKITILLNKETSPIVADITNVPAITNYGFYVKDAVGTNVPISLPVITENSIEIDVSRLLKKGDVLGYGRQGNIRDSTYYTTDVNGRAFKNYNWLLTFTKKLR